MLSGLCANVAYWKMLAEANARLSDDKKALLVVVDHLQTHQTVEGTQAPLCG
jgi:hypothetical protein